MPAAHGTTFLPILHGPVWSGNATLFARALSSDDFFGSPDPPASRSLCHICLGLPPSLPSV